MNRLSMMALVVAATMTLPRAAYADRPAPVELADCADATTMTSFAGYLECRGAFSGNINGEAGDMTELNGFGGAWAGVWSLGGKSDENPDGLFDGDPYNSGGGNWKIDFDGSIKGTFVIGVKQANFYSYYLYNSAAWISSIPVSWLGTAPDNPGFSHINLYIQDGPTGQCEFAEGCGTVVPEPSTYALMAAGLSALGLVARRRRRSA